jgi:hypothetical protein
VVGREAKFRHLALVLTKLPLAGWISGVWSFSSLYLDAES